MTGILKGTPEEKLQQVVRLFDFLAPNAACRLSDDASEIVCEATDLDGEPYVERLSLKHDLLDGEIVRHAAIRSNRDTMSAGRIGEPELWASARYLIQNKGAAAVAYVDAQIEYLTDEGEWNGAEVFKDVRRRVAVLQIDPSAWLGRA